MSSEYILALDCGTQSIRALLFDREGNLKAKDKVEFEPYFSRYPGWAENDHNLYWDSMCMACRRLKDRNPSEWEDIIGVTVTTQRDTCVLIDDAGNVLRPVILWLDQRMAECMEPLPVIDNLKFSTVGMQKTVEITRRKSKANWIRENEPEVWDKTYKFLLLSGYFTYRLSGEIVDSVGSQVGHIPFDYKKRNWPKSKGDYRWKVFGIDKEKLPKLVEPGAIIGSITKEASKETGIRQGLPLVAAGSDKGCETLGMGCFSLDSASLSFGTTATVETTSRHYFEPLQFLPSYTAAVPGYYNPEVEIFRGYWMISWFKKEFASREMADANERNISPESILNERLYEIPPGSQGLMLNPYWGPGLKMPEAKGSIIGFGDVHTRAHIYRAIVEGINYALLEGLQNIEKSSGVGIEHIMVSGGGSQSDAICQITSDMFDRPVYRGITYETSGLGAAINGFVGLNIHNSYRDAIENMVHYGKVFEPDKKSSETYKRLYENIYKRIYPRLKGLYKEIQRITNYPDF